MKEKIKKLYPYFIDIWQYLVIIVIIGLAAILYCKLFRIQAEGAN